MEFIKNHKALVITIVVIAVIFSIMLIIRHNNLAKKAEQEAQQQEQLAQLEKQEAEQQEEEAKQKEESTYKRNLGLGADESDGRVTIEEEEPVPEPEPEQTEPTYKVDCGVFDHTTVPVINNDGSSCKAYQKSLKVSDIPTRWGTELTHDDFIGGKKILIGVEQNGEVSEKGDLQSVGYLDNNLQNFAPNDYVRFTNLHVIGSLSNDHVLLLCSYDWYSVWGLRDTLVIFEDISGTLNPADFKDGDVFYTGAFAHNIKIVDNLNGQRVAVVEYNVFK